VPIASLLLVPLSAAAPPHQTARVHVSSMMVTVTDARFVPATVVAPLGERVVWRLPSTDVRTHRIADGSGLGLFTSPLLRPGEAFSYRFELAGTYRIKDLATGLTGTVRVPVALGRTSGPVGTSFDLRWATAIPPPGDRFDVEVKPPGRAGYVYFERRTVAMDAPLVASSSGQYAFASRLDEQGGGRVTRWSPPAYITVTFASVSDPIGIAATSAQVYVSRPYCGSPHQVLAIAPSGKKTLVANLPRADAPCSEDDMAMSPGTFGFPKGYLYVTQGPQIYAIPPGGRRASLFVTLTKMASNGHDGITFDSVGTFGHEMIVTSKLGEIWRVSPARVVRPVADAPSFIEGPDVIPRSIPRYGGDLLVAGEGKSLVYVVHPDGVVVPLVPWYHAEFVTSIPRTRCTLTGTPYGYFVTDYAAHGIVAYPPVSSPGLAGHPIVASESHLGVDALTVGPTGVALLPFLPGEFDPEAAAFARCPAPGR